MPLVVQVLVLLILEVILWLVPVPSGPMRDVELVWLLSSSVSSHGSNVNINVLCEPKSLFWNHFEHNQSKFLYQLFLQGWWFSSVVIGLTALKRRSAPQLQRVVREMLALPSTYTCSKRARW